MITNLYSVLDLKSKAFGTPFTAVNDEVAMRTLGNIVNNDKTHEFHLNSEDFQLFKIGKFDNSEGSVESELPEVVVLLLTLKEQPDGENAIGNET